MLAEDELGLQTTGSMPIKELLAHLEKVPSLKEIARGEGYYSLEDARKAITIDESDKIVTTLTDSQKTSCFRNIVKSSKNVPVKR